VASEGLEGFAVEAELAQSGRQLEADKEVEDGLPGLGRAQRGAQARRYARVSLAHPPRRLWKERSMKVGMRQPREVSDHVD
jgi:hypothetical protein